MEDITANGGINVFNSTNVVLKNVNVTGTGYYAVWCDENGHVTVESGSFKTNGDTVVGLTTNESELKIKGGNFVTNGKPLVLENGNQFGIPVISGGNFDVPVDEKYCAEGFDPVDDGKGNYGVCNHADTESRNAKDASCTETGYTGDVYCKNCGILIENGTEIAAFGHRMTHHDEVEPTCTEKGIAEYWNCTKCNKNFSDEAGAAELDSLDGKPAMGHKLTAVSEKKATCIKEGNTAYWMCDNCGKLFGDADGTMEITQEETVQPAQKKATQGIKCAKNAVR